MSLNIFDKFEKSKKVLWRCNIPKTVGFLRSNVNLCFEELRYTLETLQCQRIRTSLNFSCRFLQGSAKSCLFRYFWIKISLPNYESGKIENVLPARPLKNYYATAMTDFQLLGYICTQPGSLYLLFLEAFKITLLAC